MRAYRVTAHDSPPRLTEIAAPTAAPGEVLIEIAACGLNFADLLMIKGQYQETPPPPFTLGLEVAGTVRDLGEGVTGPAIGSRVAVFAGQGGLADYGCFPADRCITIPDAMPFDHAAGFLIAYGTSHLALAHRARLQPGERLLVLGAAGGVGLTAVEIGARMGAEVIACARGAAKLAVAKAAGAAHVIDSDSSDIRAEVRTLGGADVVYDAVGGAQFTAAMRATNPEGRILVIGFASGDLPQIPANHLLVKNISVIGHYWGGYMGFAPQTLTGSLETLFGWYRKGGLRPHIGATYKLDQAAEALALLKARKSTGKIVVTP
ncbi:NADPH:quinone oxidoreductase family protein [Rhodophyticola sp. CCM32]|uniref:NADPH:quinone oxidoreductase family protein n=1 Tax=Rhodophyticola sp. CCM32 TaxID=2916397 RepID=UPI00107F5B0F|nr:NADPH:quinone oxidoreductase family protein [Rhodophyticola sp. CCM32]QBY02788.1 NADPH:quinone oxidoreductase family protein [Rhodophyticola sp. CCM32]